MLPSARVGMPCGVPVGLEGDRRRGRNGADNGNASDRYSRDSAYCFFRWGHVGNVHGDMPRTRVVGNRDPVMSDRLRVNSTTRSTSADGNGGQPRLSGLLAQQSSHALAYEPLLPAPPTWLRNSARRLISAVPRPSAVARMIDARETCFCDLFRSVTTAANARGPRHPPQC